MHQQKNNGTKETLSTIGVILLAPLVAVFLTTFVFQSYQVDGPSMQQTLQHNDRLIVTKIGKTWSKLTGKTWEPERYDIVIFNRVEENGAKRQLVKRVIGLPGDRVVLKDGVITVYNAQFPNGFLVDQKGPEASNITNTPGSVDITVKPGEVFVCGDNRFNSLDSRTFGPVQESDLVGRLSLRIFPFSDVEAF